MNVADFPMLNRVLVMEDNPAVCADFKKIPPPEDGGTAREWQYIASARPPKRRIKVLN